MSGQIEHRIIGSLELRASEGDSPTLHGYAAKFNVESELLAGSFRERIKAGAFRDALKGADTLALINHDPSFVLGRTTSGTLRLKEDDVGLRVEIDPPDTDYARDLLTLVKRGDVSQMSFAFTVGEDAWTVGSDGVHLRTIKSVARLDDVSAVARPAYRQTELEARALLDERQQLDQAAIALDRERRARRLRLIEMGG
jgi:HK97 family phage prohead protease